MRSRSHIKPWMFLAGVALLAMLVLAACGGSSGGSSTPVSSASATGATSGAAVAIAGFAFAPQTITVNAGTTVTWTNNDGAPHTVTSTDGPSTSAATTGAFDSGTLAQGQPFSFTFDRSGTFYYDCTLHAAEASMHGTVIVK